MNCVKSIGCYSFSKPRPRRVRKTASAYFCRGLGCPQQAKQERRQAGERWIEISKRIFRSIACKCYRNIPI